MLEIRVIVARVGHMEPLRLLMIEFVLRVKGSFRLCSPLQTLLDVAGFWLVFRWDAMEDKSPPPGNGSKKQE